MSVRGPVLPDDQRRQTSKDRDAVNNIKVLVVGFIYPFTSSSSDLLNIATREKTAPLDLLEAKEKGQETLSSAEETINTTVTPIRLQTFHEKRQKPITSLKTKIYQKREILSGASTFFVILTVTPSAMSGLNTLLLSLSQMIKVMS